MDTIGNTAVCPKCGGIHISEASCIFLVGVVMCSQTVEQKILYFWTSPLLQDVEKGKHNEQQFPHFRSSHLEPNKVSAISTVDGHFLGCP